MLANLGKLFNFGRTFVLPLSFIGNCIAPTGKPYAMSLPVGATSSGGFARRSIFFNIGFARRSIFLGAPTGKPTVKKNAPTGKPLCVVKENAPTGKPCS